MSVDWEGNDFPSCEPTSRPRDSYRQGRLAVLREVREMIRLVQADGAVPKQEELYCVTLNIDALIAKEER